MKKMNKSLEEVVRDHLYEQFDDEISQLIQLGFVEDPERDILEVGGLAFDKGSDVHEDVCWTVELYNHFSRLSFYDSERGLGWYYAGDSFAETIAMYESVKRAGTETRTIEVEVTGLYGLPGRAGVDMEDITSYIRQYDDRRGTMLDVR